MVALLRASIAALPCTKNVLSSEDPNFMSTPLSAVESPPTQSKPKSPRGLIEKIWLEGSIVRIRGWAIGKDGREVDTFSLSINSYPVSNFSTARLPRPDVAKVFPGTEGDVGFLISLSVFDLPVGALENQAISLRPADSSYSLPLMKGFQFPATLGDCTGNLAYISNGPTMPAEAIQLLDASLRQASCYLEYGTGGSSVSAVLAKVPDIICVESDLSWLRSVAYKLRSLNIPEPRLHFCYQNIGPTGAWGTPTSNNEFRRWHNYPLGFWTDATRSLSPDLILVDGRFRVACFLASLVFAKPGAVILFDDYASRPHYHSVETFIKPEKLADRMAMFRVPKRLNANEVWAHLVAATTDYR